MSIADARDQITLLIEKYNSTHPRTLGGSPNMIESALAVYGPKVLRGELSEPTATGTPESCEVEEFPKIVVRKYAEDCAWLVLVQPEGSHKTRTEC